MWAREQDGLCAEFITFEPSGKFHPDIRWVEVPEALRPWADHSYVIAGDTVAPPSLDHLLAQMAGRLAARRWQQQTRGVVIAGRRWHTDAEAVGNITASLAMAAVYEARTGQPWSTPWKTLDGFVSVDRTGLEDAGLAVGAYVQAVFGREDAILQALTEAATAPDATAAAVIAVHDAEIDQGWPA